MGLEGLIHSPYIANTLESPGTDAYTAQINSNSVLGGKIPLQPKEMYSTPGNCRNKKWLQSCCHFIVWVTSLITTMLITAK